MEDVIENIFEISTSMSIFGMLASAIVASGYLKIYL